MEKSFGVILAMGMSDFDIPREEVITAFNDAGFEERFIPNERMPRKAFQKALKEAVQGEDGFMIRPVVKKGSTMSSGLVKEQKDAESRDLKYDVFNVVTLDSEMEIIQGKSDFRTTAIVEAYKDYKGKLGSTEIGLKIGEILFESMAINVLCEKGIFIPEKYKENVDKLIKLFAKIKEAGGNAEIEVMGVDSGTQTRNTIVKHFSNQTLVMLDKQIEFCLSQRERFESGKVKYLRPTAFKKQLLKLKTLEERIRTYIVLLELTPEEDRQIIEKMAQADEEISKNIEIAQSSSKRGSKKVMSELRQRVQ